VAATASVATTTQFAQAGQFAQVGLFIAISEYTFQLPNVLPLPKCFALA
jgi:hypothetical protein